MLGHGNRVSGLGAEGFIIVVARAVRFVAAGTLVLNATLVSKKKKLLRFFLGVTCRWSLCAMTISGGITVPSRS